MKKVSKFIKIFLSTIVIVCIVYKIMDFTPIQRANFSPFLHKDNYTSQYIYIVDRDSKEVVYEKNAHAKTYPASLTKIMTTLVAIENIEDLSAVAPVDVESYKKMVDGNSSMAGFVGREQVTYRDLLYGTILNSGGEAANSLAINITGDMDSFVQMMNEKAESIGLENTHFTNPEGFDDKKQFTTAYDMAQLLNVALDNGHFRAIFTTESFLTTATPDHPEGIWLVSTVLSQINQYTQNGFEIIGGKSGTTYGAGQCWATLGLTNEKEYISIVMGAPLDDISNPDRAQIIDTLDLFENIE